MMMEKFKKENEIDQFIVILDKWMMYHHLIIYHLFLQLLYV